MYRNGCEFCGDIDRDLVYLAGHTHKLVEEAISRGLTAKSVKSRDLVFQCSCGIIASVADREIYNEHVTLERDHIQEVYNGMVTGHLLEFETMQAFPRSYRFPDFNLSRANNTIEWPPF